MPQTEIKKNLLSQTLWVSAIIIISLLLLALLPETNIGPFQLREIDILSDLHPDPPILKVIKVDSIPREKPIPTVTTQINISITQIEDFSGDKKPLMHFINALKESDCRQVRVAFFGDSFIEGDIISATLRDTLQHVFGGSGVGLVPLATEVSGFRRSLKHTHADWEILSLRTTPDTTIPMGISGYSYIPRIGNTVKYKPGLFPMQKDFKVVKVFYQNKGSASLAYKINDEEEIMEAFDRSDSIKKLTVVHQAIKSIQFSIIPEDSVVFFGASLENNTGLYIDNFSMRGNSGIVLAKLSPTLLKEFNEYLDYKLIILQYGLNVASENDSTDFTWYTNKMIKIITELKVIFPKTSFLLVSVSDRGVNKDGKIITMKSIPRVREIQREIAKKSGIAFWDMFEAMGGENSIAAYTESVPPLAAKDYTHLTHLGGEKIGKKLAAALLEEFHKNEK